MASGRFSALRVGINVVGDAVFPDATFRVLPATRQFVGTDILERLDKWRTSAAGE